MIPLVTHLEEITRTRELIAEAVRDLEREGRPAARELPLGVMVETPAAVVMIDAIHFRDRIILVALGIDALGNKHVLGLREGSTESTRVVRSLLSDLVERGLDADRPRLWVIDGGKALRRAITQTFGAAALIQRCQEHKRRNVLDHLPKTLHASVNRAMRDAYAASDADLARRQLQRLASSLTSKHPGAAASLREGLAETFTVARLRVPPTLARTLRSTNAVESMIEICRDHSANVKRWESGTMALRWCAAGLAEAKKQFRRVNGHLHLRALRTALDDHVAAAVTPPAYTAEQEVAA